MTGAVTVLSGTVAIPAGLKAGDWFEMPLTTVFNYDSSQPLVVHFDHSAATSENTNTIRGVNDDRFAGRMGGNNTQNYTNNPIVVWGDNDVLPMRFWLQ